MSDDKSPYFMLGVFGETIKFTFQELYKVHLQNRDYNIACELTTILNHLREARDMYEEYFGDQ